MNRGHLHFWAALAIDAIGVAAVIGILFALMTGTDYHPLVVLAAGLYLVFRPLFMWISGRTRKQD